MFMTETTTVLFSSITSKDLPALNATIVACLDPIESVAYLLHSGSIRTFCLFLSLRRTQGV